MTYSALPTVSIDFRNRKTIQERQHQGVSMRWPTLYRPRLASCNPVIIIHRAAVTPTFWFRPRTAFPIPTTKADMRNEANVDAVLE